MDVFSKYAWVAPLYAIFKENIWPGDLVGMG